MPRLPLQVGPPPVPLDPPGRPIAVTHVTVVPMVGPKRLADHTVVIEGATIRAVAPSAQVDPSGMTVIDGAGKFLMPGLADMHTHYDDPTEFGMFLANGVTFVRNMWGRPLHLALKREVDEHRWPGPHLMTTTPLVDGAGESGHTMWPGSILLDDPDRAAPLVRSLVRRGYQQIKVYSWLRHDCLQAVGQAASEAGVAVTGHCPEGVTFEQAIDSGMTCFEHLTNVAAGHLLDGAEAPATRDRSPAARLNALRLLAESMDWTAIRRLAHSLASAGIWNCPTLVLWQQMALDEESGVADRLIRYEHPVTVAMWRPHNDPRLRVRKGEAEFLSLSRRRAEVLSRVLSIFHEEGAPLLVGTDTPNPYVFQGFSMHQELRNFADAGIPAYEALRCATVAAAEFVGEQDTWGTITPGKRADLLVLGSDPLRDVSAVRDLKGVFVSGVYHPETDLAQLLEQRSQEVARAHQPVGGDRWISVIDGISRSQRLSESLAGSIVGHLEYSVEELEAGGWLIKEAYYNTFTHEARRSTILLDRDCILTRARSETHTMVGTATCRIDLRDVAEYEVEVVDVDGEHELATVTGHSHLLPSEAVSITALAFALGRCGDRGWRLLDIHDAEPRVYEVDARPGPGVDAQARPLEWHIAIDPPGEHSEQIFHYDSDGSLTKMTEHAWRGLREMTTLAVHLD